MTQETVNYSDAPAVISYRSVSGGLVPFVPQPATEAVVPVWVEARADTRHAARGT